MRHKLSQMCDVSTSGIEPFMIELLSQLRGSESLLRKLAESRLSIMSFQSTETSTPSPVQETVALTLCG